MIPLFLFILVLCSIPTSKATPIRSETHLNKLFGDDADYDDQMSFTILSGVFIIVGGIISTFIKKDVSKRNMSDKKWMVLLALTVILAPVIDIYLIVNYELTSFISVSLLGLTYFVFFAPYIYFKRRSLLIVDQVPAEFMVRLTAAYRDILAFGVFLSGLVLMIMSIYNFAINEKIMGKVLFSVSIPLIIAGSILIWLWFSMDKISISTREIQIYRQRKANIITWGKAKKIIFYQQSAPLFTLHLPGYRKKMGPKGAERVVEIISKNHILKIKESDIPSEQDFRLLFFILLYHRKRSNPECRVEFKGRWARSWYGDYRKHISNSN